ACWRDGARACPEKWEPVFPATNAKRLRGDHAQTKELKGDRVSKRRDLILARSRRRQPPEQFFHRHADCEQPPVASCGTVELDADWQFAGRAKRDRNLA